MKSSVATLLICIGLLIFGNLPCAGATVDPSADSTRNPSYETLVWVNETVDSYGDSGKYTSLVLDSNGKPHISYCRGGYAGGLRYAKKIDVSWSIATVESSDWTSIGWTSIALDVCEYPHITYSYDEVLLKYARWTGSSWSKTDVDGSYWGPEVGKGCSIALDSNGYPHISYYDKSNGNLKYARWMGSSWDITTVDSVGDVGQYTSLALDSNGYPHISYWDAYPDYDLKYAWWNGSAWINETVDFEVGVGEYTSLALDSNDRTHISYFDRTNYDLKYAKRIGGSWVNETVDSAGSVGWYTSIAVDSNDNPHISYYDDTNHDLKYAKWTGGSWEIETVDAPGDVGQWTSIALDSNNYPHISYYDVGNKALKYARVRVNNPPSFGIDSTPLTATTGDSFTFSINVTDDIELDSVYMEYWYGTGEHTNLSMSCTTPPTYTKTIPIPHNLTPFHYFFTAKDRFNLWNSTSIKTVTVSDNDNPTFGADATPTSATTGDQFTFSIDVEDNIELSSVYVEYWYGTGVHTNLSMSCTSPHNYTRTITIPHNLVPLRYFFTANDTSGLWAATAAKDVTVTDNDYPTFGSDLTPTSGRRGEEFKFCIEISDNIGISSAKVEYWFEGEAYHTISTLRLEEGRYTYVISIPSNKTGILHYIFTATDTSGNSASTMQKDVTIEPAKTWWTGWGLIIIVLIVVILTIVGILLAIILRRMRKKS